MKLPTERMGEVRSAQLSRHLPHDLTPGPEASRVSSTSTASPAMDFDDALLADAEQEQEQLDEPQPSPPAAQQAEPPPQPLKQSTLSFGQQQPAAYLPALNPAQRRAVTAPATGSLQILAGPGSGERYALRVFEVRMQGADKRVSLQERPRCSLRGWHICCSTSSCYPRSWCELRTSGRVRALADLLLALQGRYLYQ